MLPDSTCRLLACDFDDATWRRDEVAAAAGVPVAVEVSRSGEGAHAWTFFTEPVPAADARALGAALLREAMAVVSSGWTATTGCSRRRTSCPSVGSAT